MVLDMWHFLAEPNFLHISNSNANAFLLESVIIKHSSSMLPSFWVAPKNLWPTSLPLVYINLLKYLMKYIVFTLEKEETGQKEKFSCNPISSLSNSSFGSCFSIRCSSLVLFQKDFFFHQTKLFKCQMIVLPGTIFSSQKMQKKPFFSPCLAWREVSRYYTALVSLEETRCLFKT